MHSDKSLKAYRQAITDEGLVQIVYERRARQHWWWQPYNPRSCQWQDGRKHQQGNKATVEVAA